MLSARIEIDALRQLGGMLRATERAKGDLKQGSVVPKKNHGENDAPTLSDLGINKKTSSLAQKLSVLPAGEVATMETSVRTGSSITQAAKGNGEGEGNEK